MQFNFRWLDVCFGVTASVGEYWNVLLRGDLHISR